MDDDRFDYDSRTRRLTYRTGLRGGKLLPAETAKAIGRVARAGEWNGRRVEAVAVRFDDDATARANADAMTFVHVQSEGPGGVAGSDARFPAREDFGISDD